MKQYYYIGRSWQTVCYGMAASTLIAEDFLPALLTDMDEIMRPLVIEALQAEHPVYQREYFMDKGRW